MNLRFLCSTHRKWLESDSSAARTYWLSSYSQGVGQFQAGENVKAVNHAGSALEAAELLLLTHAQRSAPDIHRFTDSAVLLCHALRAIEQPRLLCGVIGGCITRLEEVLLEGANRTTVLQVCQRLLTVGDEAPMQSRAIPHRELASSSLWNVH